jgi:hypothetical protein
LILIGCRNGEESENKEGEVMKETFRKFALGLALLAIATLGVPMALAQQQGGTGAPSAQAPQTVTIKGMVSNVSASSVTVVDSAKAEQTIAIDAKTKITKAGKDATAADLKANDNVEVVAAKGEGNALTAITIKVG